MGVAVEPELVEIVVVGVVGEALTSPAVWHNPRAEVTALCARAGVNTDPDMVVVFGSMAVARYRLQALAQPSKMLLLNANAEELPDTDLSV